MADKSIRERISEDIVQGFKNATDVIGTHTKEILGDAINSLIDDVKRITEGIWDVIKGSFKTIGDMFGGVIGFFKKPFEKKQLEESEKQTTLLQKIVGIFKKRDKRDIASFDEENKGFFATIIDNVIAIFILFTVALSAALGGIIGAIVMPFKVLISFFKTLIPVKTMEKIKKSINLFFLKILNFFTKIPVIGPFIAKFTKSFQSFLSGVSRFTTTIIKNSKYLTKIANAFKVGFRVLGWPLTILLGVIDFIRGWTKTSGTWIEKLKGGLTSVIQGFLDLPIRLLGWVVDWVLKQFNIDLGDGGSAKIMMDSIKKSIDILINTISYVFSGIKIGIDVIINVLKSLEENFGIFSLIKDTFLRLFEIIKNVFLILYNSIKVIIGVLSFRYDGGEMFNEAIQGLKDSFSNILKNILEQIKSVGQTIYGFFEWIGNKFLEGLSYLNPINWFTMPTFDIEGLKMEMIAFFTNAKNSFMDGLSYLNPINWFPDDFIIDGSSIWLTIKGYATLIKDKFMEIVNKFNPMNWFKNEETNSFELPDTVKSVFSFLGEIGTKIREKLNSIIGPILAKIPNWALPENLENLKQQLSSEKQKTEVEKISEPNPVENVTTNNVREFRTEKTTETPPEEIKISNELLQEMVVVLKQMNGKLNKDQNIVQQNTENVQNTNKNNSVAVNQQNNSNKGIQTSNKQIPEENQYLGIGLMNSNVTY